MSTRVLGRSGIKVSAIGFGCWAIGGPFTMDGKPDGWGEVDDRESAAAIRRALDLGVAIWLQPGHPALLRANRPAGPRRAHPSGHRRFGEDDLEWLEVLRCLRDTGMPIARMR